MESRTLLLIGGGERRKEDNEIMQALVRLSGGSKARIAVVTAATQFPEETGAEYARIFTALGADQVRIVHVLNRADACLELSLTAIEEATGVFFTGGDQLLVTCLIGGSPMDQLLHQKLEQGIMIAGTSAGAAMMAGSMIVRGKTNAAPQYRSIDIGPGMGFLPRVLIDTHFSQRGRFGRLTAGVAHNPQYLGIGIDNNTAILVNGQTFEVIGEGAVMIIDASEVTFSNLARVKPNQTLSLFDLKVHVLAKGYRFDLQDRRPV